MKGIQNTDLFTYYKMNPAYATNPIPANDTLVLIDQPDHDGRELRSIIAVDIGLCGERDSGTARKANVELDTRVQIRQRYNGGLSGS